MCLPIETTMEYVSIRETHTAVVFLVGDRAYKMKKPVDLGFLDFRTREARSEVCHKETDLNRRLAPDVYLGVAQITDPDGQPCEDLLVMRRMPDNRRLSTLVRSGADVSGDIRRIARVVAAFHSRCDRSPQIDVEGSRDALLERWTASFEQVRPFHGNVIDGAVTGEIERLTARFLAGREQLFADRLGRGRIVDGHGDLLADDIFCLLDGPRILDCLEFDDRLRHVDQLDDVAFLAMDLEHLGAPDLAERFIKLYVEFTGDPAPSSLLHHYVAYRAFVRAKVSCLRHQQGDPAAAGQARTFSDLAQRHLATSAVKLVLVGGMPGAGKSTLASGLADRLGLVMLSSDRLRKELAGVDPEQSARADYRAGIYSRAWTERTYAEMLERAGRLLSLGESVVLDASWIDQGARREAQQVAARSHSDVVSLLCEVPEEVAAARMRERSGPSDADEAVAAAMRGDADAWPEATLVNTSLPLDVGVAHAVSCVRPNPEHRRWVRLRPLLET